MYSLSPCPTSKLPLIRITADSDVTTGDYSSRRQNLLNILLQQGLPTLNSAKSDNMQMYCYFSQLFCWNCNICNYDEKCIHVFSSICIQHICIMTLKNWLRILQEITMTVCLLFAVCCDVVRVVSYLQWRCDDNKTFKWSAKWNSSIKWFRNWTCCIHVFEQFYCESHIHIINEILIYDTCTDTNAWITPSRQSCLQVCVLHLHDVWLITCQTCIF